MIRISITALLFALSFTFTACDLGGSGGGGGNGDGAVTITVPDDFATIQAAIDAAANGDIIVVLDGTYTGAGNKNLDLGGKAITLRSESATPSGNTMTLPAMSAAANCYIDCEGDGRGFYFHNNETSSSVVDGFTIINGMVTGTSFPDFSGGGILCYDSSPTIRNCIIRENTTVGTSALSGGAGIYCEGSSPTIINCTISDNMADWYGGGIHAGHLSSPTIANCTISGNSCGAHGGGIYCRDAVSPEMSGCIVVGNSSGQRGGGIYCLHAEPTITNCVISVNMAALGGGGIEFQDDSPMHPTVDNCIISSNSAGDGGSGGGLRFYLSDRTIIDSCIISGNWAYYNGGGIHCSNNGALPTIINCIISGNMVEQNGGGVAYTDECEASITNCTIAENCAGLEGGGIYCGLFTDPIVTNCILWGDEATNGNELALDSHFGDWPATLVISYSDVEGGQAGVWTEPNTTLFWGAGNIGSSPLDDPLFVGGPSGTATGVSYDPDTYQSTLTDTSASFTPGALARLILVPNITDGSQFVIAGNDANSITVWGDTTQVAATLAPFDDYEVKDYHIQAASPCIDAGTDVGVDTDIDGDTRPQSIQVDMGADEYSG